MVAAEREAREALGGHLSLRLDGVDAAARAASELPARVAALHASSQAIEGAVAAEVRARGELEERFDAAERRLERVRSETVQQGSRIGLLLEEARRRLPEPFDDEQLKTLADEAQHALDALYLMFEDQFRGSRADVRDRLRVYLPVLEGVRAGSPGARVLDVACGRGEWLELLREVGLVARGVDRSRAMIEHCRGLGLEVAEAELIEHLRKLPSGSLGAVTGFHIVEHLPVADLIHLLDETVRVLLPGGVAIFETPNPANVLVATQTFYLDPTHRNPLPSAMLQFLAEARGLCRVEVRELHPHPRSERIRRDDAVARRFNEHFYGPRDYAVIGYKP